MVAIPAPMPVTTPAAFTVATLVAVVLHIPPAAVSDSVILAPTQTDEGPEIVPAEGVANTVSV